MIRRTLLLGLALATTLTAGTAVAARADDTVNASIGQRGAWDTMVIQQGLDQGFFKKEKLAVTTAYTAGGPDTIQAVATGSADIGIGVGTTAVIAAFAKGAPVRIASAEMTGAGDLYFYAKNDSPIASFKDMNGKSIGFTKPGSSTYAAEHVLATQDNVKPTFVSTGEMAATLTQVMSGQVDVGWAVVPINFDSVKKKEIKIIARGSEAKDLAGQTIRVNITNANFMSAHRDVAVRFWKAYAATVDWMYKNPKQAVANFARYNGISADEAKVVLPYYSREATKLATISAFDKSVADAVEFKFIPKPLDADQQKAIFDIVLDKK